MKKTVYTTIALLLALYGQAWAADRSHQYTNLAGKQVEEEWWQTMAFCAGRTKVLATWAGSQKRPEVKTVEEWATMFWLLAINRLKKDRGIGEEDAAKIALEAAQSMAQTQQQGIWAFTAAGTMEQEYKQKIDYCQMHLNAYAAAFPEDFKKN